MNNTPTTFEINGRTYIIGTWDVDKSLETLVWLAKTFGEGFLTLFMSEDGFETTAKVAQGEVNEAEESLMQDFVSAILNKLDPKEYVKYSKIICSGVRCNGQDIDFKFHFAGKMGEMHRVMFAILKHQYSDFLPESVGAE